MRALILFQLLVCTSVLGLNKITITVKTNKGPINGRLEHVSIDRKAPLIAKYYGIPYAESTSGLNRFRKPLPKAPFTTPFDATGDKPVMACFQQTILEMNIFREKYGVQGFSEDCLSLNIFSPYGGSTRMPVMVWFHGGGFRQGAASMYNPEALAVFGQVIVVTVNYRVGMFGFLRDRMGVIPGNQGLWDQRLALEWIHENIKHFKGDNRDITIFGQSAGASLALLHALFPGNKGLFTRVIAESGSSLAPWSIKDIDSLEQYLMDVGCQPNTNSTLRCMQSKDPMMLLNDNAIFGPVIDGELLTDFPEEIMFGNNPLHVPARTFFSSLDIMIGFNDMDGVLFYNTWASLLKKASLDFDITQDQYDNIIVPEYVKTKFRSDYTNETRSALAELIIFFYTDWADPSNLLSIRNCIVAMTNDPMFYMPAIQVAKAHSQLQQLKKGNTYFYEFSVQSDRHPLAVPYWLKGSYHADEIPYVFGFPLLANSTLFGNDIGNYTAEEKQISRTTMSFWSNFAKSGNPNKPIPATNPSVIWPKFSVTSQHYFQISNTASRQSVVDLKDFHPRRMAFWSQLVPKMIKLIQNGYLKRQGIERLPSQMDILGTALAKRQQPDMRRNIPTHSRFDISQRTAVLQEAQNPFSYMSQHLPTDSSRTGGGTNLLIHGSKLSNMQQPDMMLNIPTHSRYDPSPRTATGNEAGLLFSQTEKHLPMDINQIGGRTNPLIHGTKQANIQQPDMRRNTPTRTRYDPSQRTATGHGAGHLFSQTEQHLPTDIIQTGAGTHLPMNGAKQANIQQPNMRRNTPTNTRYDPSQRTATGLEAGRPYSHNVQHFPTNSNRTGGGTHLLKHGTKQVNIQQPDMRRDTPTHTQYDPSQQTATGHEMGHPFSNTVQHLSTDRNQTGPGTHLLTHGSKLTNIQQPDMRRDTPTHTQYDPSPRTATGHEMGRPYLQTAQHLQTDISQTGAGTHLPINSAKQANIQQPNMRLDTLTQTQYDPNQRTPTGHEAGHPYLNTAQHLPTDISQTGAGTHLSINSAKQANIQQQPDMRLDTLTQTQYDPNQQTPTGHEAGHPYLNTAQNLPTDISQTGPGTHLPINGAKQANIQQQPDMRLDTLTQTQYDPNQRTPTGYEAGHPYLNTAQHLPTDISQTGAGTHLSINSAKQANIQQQPDMRLDTLTQTQYDPSQQTATGHEAGHPYLNTAQHLPTDISQTGVGSHLSINSAKQANIQQPDMRLDTLTHTQYDPSQQTATGHGAGHPYLQHLPTDISQIGGGTHLLTHGTKLANRQQPGRRRNTPSHTRFNKNNIINNIHGYTNLITP